jgi:uncharacterized membrane-anchored protein
MRRSHVPALGLRYWSALCLASVFDANMGDFFAHDIGLGHVCRTAVPGARLRRRLGRWALRQRGAWDLLSAGDRDRFAPPLPIWPISSASILRLPKPYVMAGLALRLALSVAAAWRLWRRRAPDKSDAPSNLLRGDAGYWLAVLIAGTLGTVMGDFSPTTCISAIRSRRSSWARCWRHSSSSAPGSASPRCRLYWTTIVMVCAAGTTVGDLVVACHALGLLLSTAVTDVLFVGCLVIWRNARRDDATIPARSWPRRD